MPRLSLLALLVIGACRLQDTPSVTPRDAVTAVAEELPAPVPHGRVTFRVPVESEITDTSVLRAVRRGRALLAHTRDSLPSHVGNALQCVSCHQNDGTVKDAMPWVGVYSRFPQYRSRAGTVQIIEDRVNDCFKRSMNGKGLVPESREMRDIVAYFAFLSSGYPVGAQVDGQGIPQLKPVPGDTARGASLFAQQCSVCHGKNGGGTAAGPPVWGPQSYNIGAGMARVRTAAAFIRQAMPKTSPGVLTEQQAYDLATYINTRPRPDFRGKQQDWPYGDPPADVAYPTDAVRRLRAAGAR